MDTECILCKDKIIELKNIIIELENKNNDLSEHLKKYTSPQRYKKYYEEHKQELINKNKEYFDKIPTEKRKEYARKAYLNKKEKEKLKLLQKTDI